MLKITRRGIGLFLAVILMVGGFTPCFAAEVPGIVKFGQDIEIAANQVVKDAVAIGGSVTVLGKVENSVVAIGGSIYLKPGASVGKDAVAIGGKVEKWKAANLGGKIVEHSGFAFPVNINPECVTRGIMVFTGLAFIAFLALALVIVALFTANIGRISYRVERNVWPSLLAGVAGSLLVLPAVIALLISLAGIPLIPVFLFLVFLAFLVGYISVAQLIGKKVLSAIRVNNVSILLEEALGLIILFFALMLPVLGVIIKALVALTGFGAVILTQFGTKA